MAAIDDLIAQIEDKALRERLAVETARITKQKKFGLVFEDHLPELTLIHNAKVKKNSKVALRDGKLSDLWRVLSVRNGEAHCRQVDSGETRQIPLDELTVVRQFGDPIFPALTPVGRVQNGPQDAPWHTLIEADNYHALQLLEYLYAGKVDCIYIDPPYNSGARDWKYNNDYVDSNDTYRHSKWLAMMQRRLKIAKRLLNSKNSVLIVAIDENEAARLRLLLQQNFPASKIQMVTVLINPAGASIIDQFSRVDEQLYFVHVGSARPIRTVADTTPGTSTIVTVDGKVKPFQWESFLRSGGNSRRQDTKAKFFPVYVDAAKNKIIGCGEHLPDAIPIHKAPKQPKGLIAQWPIKSDGSEACWQTSAATFRNYLKAGRVKLGRLNRKTGRYGISFLPKGAMRAIAAGELVIHGKDENGSLIVKNAEGRRRSQVGKTVWTNVAYSATEYGSTLLRSFIPRRKFPFPKSLYAVEDALRFYLAEKPNAVVLDFFAGSGTTAHAVMRLNHQDTGRRQCISVTNNEVAADEEKALRNQGFRPGDPEWEKWGICKQITMPRIEAAITGKTPEGKRINGNYKFIDAFPMADGFRANLEYFQLNFLDKNNVALGRQFREILPILWLRSGAIGPRPQLPKNKPIPSMLIPEHNPFAVLVDETRFADFAAAVEDRHDLSYVYLVTDSEEAFQEMATQLKVPDVIQLYRDYLENFVINNGEDTA